MFVMIGVFLIVHVFLIMQILKYNKRIHTVTYKSNEFEKRSSASSGNTIGNKLKMLLFIVLEIILLMASTFQLIFLMV